MIAALFFHTNSQKRGAIAKVNKIREKIFIDFDSAFLEVVLESINFVLSKKQYLSDKTIELYNSLIIKN